jgi:hypothetical protein
MKRKMRNNFNKYLDKVKELRRLEHIQKKCSWFTETRGNTNLNDCFQSWRLFFKKSTLAKKFLTRSAASIDK